jgi:uncharacterized membrane protein YfcA
MPTKTQPYMKLIITIITLLILALSAKSQTQIAWVDSVKVPVTDTVITFSGTFNLNKSLTDYQNYTVSHSTTISVSVGATIGSVDYVTWIGNGTDTVIINGLVNAGNLTFDKTLNTANYVVAFKLSSGTFYKIWKQTVLDLTPPTIITDG